MENFWASSVWGTYLVLGILFVAIMLAQMVKRSVPFLRKSLIPTSVLGGVLILIFEGAFKFCSGGNALFDAAIFDGKAYTTLEVLTYHCLALGFIASTLKSSSAKFDKKRSIEIFNTGVTTVSTYLMQGVLGLGITLIAACFLKDFFQAAGVLLPFGYGQGTGQAMNYGGIYEQDYGFVGGKTFGLTVAALGFLSAAIGGVFHLNVVRKSRNRVEETLKAEGKTGIEGANEIPMQESMDKITVQVALVAVAYLIAYGMMAGLGALLPGMKATVYGFNFLLGVIAATLVKAVLNFCNKKNIIHRTYTNNFLLTRVSNFFFDVMVIAGVAAIRLDQLDAGYWGVMLVLGIVGLIATYGYNYFIAKKLFPEYADQQFLMMYGMLTGTASTGTILLREIDQDFKTPAADNLVYQNFPAIVFGFPMMLLATLAPQKPVLTWVILLVFFIVMNVILFRSFIFHKRKK